MALQAEPSLIQLVDMLACPFDDRLTLCPGQLTLEDHEVAKPQCCVVFRALHVHMRPRVVIDPYSDDDVAPAAQLGHNSICRRHVD